MQNGSALLTTITNDAWFGRSSAPWQHFAMAAMRAVEQGRYLVRAANTGISGVVDPYGRVVLQSGLFVEGAWTADVRLIEEKTIYGQTGDWVVWGSLLLTALALAHNHDGTKARRHEVVSDILKIHTIVAFVPSRLRGCGSGTHKQGSSGVAFEFDDQIKRYKDLVKRTSDLRSYL